MPAPPRPIPKQLLKSNHKEIWEQIKALVREEERKEKEKEKRRE